MVPARPERACGGGGCRRRYRVDTPENCRSIHGNLYPEIVVQLSARGTQWAKVCTIG